MSRTLYQTTPIYYVNDVPHPGHAYTTVAADTLARARRLQGHRVFFLTGTDEHGQNIERIAREKGIAPQEHCDRIVAVFKALWERLDIRYDRFIRTTDEIHERGVLRLWEAMRTAVAPSGEPAVYRGTYAGYYCPRCEAFKDEDELRQPGNICPDHERPCDFTEEENLFFRLSAYSGWLQEEIEGGRLQIDPAGRRNEVLAVIRDGLKDFSISRARVKWGIAVPEDPGHVFYVWMDALANYVTALGFAADALEYRTFWKGADERLHFVGKEIIRFHCLYWPAMLRAAGLPVPTRVYAHGHLTKNGKKLSKTTGNTIDPDVLIDRFGVDAFRYFFLREGSFGQDWDFTDEAYVRRYNSDLANDLGNLVSRALTMAVRYADGRVPQRPAVPGAPFVNTGEVFARYEAMDFSGALALVWTWVAQCNQRIVVAEPWNMARDEARKVALADLLYELLESIRLIAILISPVVPGAAQRVLRMLGSAGEVGPEDLIWGRLLPGAPLGTIEPLFPRIEVEAREGRPAKEKKKMADGPPAETTQAAPPDKTEITIDEFARLELKVAEVKTAERIAGSKKLLRIEVDLGGETRQIVSGIADAYTPESLVGKKVVLVANLKPAKLMGVESFGMVLAASIGGKAVLCTLDTDVPAGTKVK